MAILLDHLAVAMPESWSESFREMFLRQLQIWRDGNDRYFDHADTFRVARIHVPEEVAVFEKLRQAGCCATFDHMLMVPDAGPRCGTIVIFGFNYGH